MAELALVSSIIAVIQISQDVITRAYKYGQAVKNSKEDMERVQTELQDLKNILDKLKDLAQRATAGGRSMALWPTLVSLQDPTSPLHRCHSELARLQPGLAPVSFLERFRARALWPHKRREINQNLNTIKRQKVHLIEALNIDQAGQILETAQVVNDTAKLQIGHKEVSLSTQVKVTSLKDNEIIRWLLSTDASINLVAALDKRMENTGNWFLDSNEYDSWKNGGSSFLWLHGPSGCGKTVLCSTAVNDTCESFEGSPLAYYYFDITDRDKQAVSNLLRSIIGQFCTQMEAIPEMVSTLYKDYGAGGLIPRQTLINTLITILPQINKPRIFIDALDECKEMDILLDLIKLLHTSSQGNLQMIATSQKQNRIADILQDIATGFVSFQSDITDHDIGLYVRGSLSENGKLRKWRNHPIKDKIVTTLQDGAEGSFRWASCQIDSLRGCSSEDDVRSALKDLPLDLNETYDRILNRICDQDRTPQGSVSAKIKAALQWLAFAQRPLRLEEVAEASAIDPEHPFRVSSRIIDPHLISDSCSSLVTITLSTHYEHPGRQELRFAHPSVQRYLTSERLRSQVGLASSFAFSESSAHSFICKSCLRYLLHFDKPDSITSGSFPTFRLARYSAKYWPEHYRAIVDLLNKTAADNLGIDLLSLESNCFKNWIRIRDPDRFSLLNPTRNLTRKRFASPLYYVSEKGLLGLATRLLEEGADVNAYGGQWGYALSAAAFGRYTEVVQLLLANGADVNAQDGRDYSALTAALDLHEVDVNLVLLLLDNGADVNALGVFGRSAVEQAAIDGQYGIVDLLLSRGFDLTRTDVQGRSILHRASSRGNTELVKRLLSLNMDARALDSQGRNCLQLACAGGNTEIIDLLLALGLGPGAVDKQRRSCLHHAAVADQAIVTERLLSQKLDPNAADRDGWTPLHWAAKGNRPFGRQRDDYDLTIRYLLDAGADITLKTSDGWTPHSVAIFHHQAPLLPLLASDKRLTSEAEIVVTPGRWHPYSFCAGCEMEIYGTRYACLDCPQALGFDFCFKCNYSAAETHPGHKFKIMEVPKEDSSREDSGCRCSGCNPIISEY